MEADAIYMYSDFRQFLKDHYQYHKASTRGYSFRSFARAAGFTSPNFIKLVMDGEKNLTQESALQLAQAMGLDAKATAYFQELVRFAQARDMESKRQAMERMEDFRRRNHPEDLVDADAAYLRHWHLPVLREMTALPDFDEDPAWIARRLAFPLPAKEIRSALEFLETQGFLKRDAKGRLQRKERTLSTGDLARKPLLGAAAREYHLQMAGLARQAVFQMPKESRSVSNTTLSLSREGYATALKRIEALRMELLEFASQDTGAQDVHQLSVTLFPLTRVGR